MTLIVACGLKREARVIAKSSSVVAVAGGGNHVRLERELNDLASRHSGPILSSGLAGGLDPSLRVGDVVLSGDQEIVERLRGNLPSAVIGTVVGSDTAVATAAAKQVLRERSGAVAVDMETSVAQRVASRLGRPFATLRVISDTADTTLPPAALVGMRPDGGIALAAVLGSLLRQPGQLPALIRTGRDAGLAFRRLSDVYDALLRAGIGGTDAGEFALDMR